MSSPAHSCLSRQLTPEAAFDRAEATVFMQFWPLAPEQLAATEVHEHTILCCYHPHSWPPASLLGLACNWSLQCKLTSHRKCSYGHKYEHLKTNQNATLASVLVQTPPVQDQPFTLAPSSTHYHTGLQHLCSPFRSPNPVSILFKPAAQTSGLKHSRVPWR